jgi:hypothetical protein
MVTSDQLLDLFGSGDYSAWAEVIAQTFAGQHLLPPGRLGGTVRAAR